MHLTPGRREKVKAKVYHETLPYTRDSISLHDDANAHSEFNSNQAVGLFPPVLLSFAVIVFVGR